MADEHHVLLCSSLGMPCPVTRKHLLQKERQDCSKGGGVARRTLLEAHRHLMQNCLGPLNVWPPHSSCPDPQGSTKAGTLCMSSCHSSPPSLPNEDRKNLPPERRHKIQVRQNLAIPLVPKYKKMTIPLKKKQFKFYNQWLYIAIHCLLSGLGVQEPLFFKASQGELGALLVCSMPPDQEQVWCFPEGSEGVSSSGSQRRRYPEQ